MIDLTIIWAGIIGFAIVAYVIMDGFDLGIGIVFPTLDKLKVAHLKKLPWGQKEWFEKLIYCLPFFT